MKIAPRKYVHLLLFISELAFIACSVMMFIIRINNSDDDRREIWMGSKILTLKELMKNNSFNSYPILYIYPNGTKIYYKYNYAELLKHSGKECEEKYKQCGILDTLGNIMCIPEEDECPINEMIVDLDSNDYLYTPLGYNITYLENFTENYALYFTNKAIEKEIITKIKMSNETPTYINPDNFIFDEKAYLDYLDSFSDSDGYGGYDSGGYDGGGGGDGGGGDIGGGGGGFRRLTSEEYGDETITKYIQSKFKEELNIDQSFKNISDNLYVGNYIGFKDFSNLDKYDKAELYDTYFIVFPNEAAFIFCIINILLFGFLIIFSIIRFCHKDIENEGFDERATLLAKLRIIIPYIVFFIGYLTYFIYEYINIYQKRNPEALTDIEADPFIEDFLAEIKNRNPKKGYLLSMIIIYSCSMVIFILAWILSQIFTKRYLRLLERTRLLA